MKGYILAIISVSVLCGVTDMLCPEGVRNGFKKALGFITALLMICVLANPVISCFEAIKGKDLLSGFEERAEEYSEEKYKQAWVKAIENMTTEETENHIIHLVSEEFDISEKDLSAKIKP